MRLSPPDPRDFFPSRADPESRKHRKELEKEHAFGLKEVAVLGLIGLTLAWDMDKQVRKREERKDKEEAEQQRRRERRGRGRGRGRGQSGPSSSNPRRDTQTRDNSSSGKYTSDPRRRQSVDHHASTRYDDRYDDDDDGRRYKGPASRRYDAYDGQYNVSRDLDRAERGRSRRDSW
ncbi:hypothetical protein GGS20DRAFT_284650 [Poronia punctata]|nr:hypothetical protein GGS20DRAFT_284650 [Poronia punctata]